MKAKLGNYISSFKNHGKKIRINCLDEYQYPGDGIYVHESSGLVTSALTHTPEEILDYWTNKIFLSNSQEDYSAFRPFAMGRLLYVARYMLDYIVENPRYKGNSFCDFASGQGVLPMILKAQAEASNWKIEATEGSEVLCEKLRDNGFVAHHGALGMGGLDKFQVDFGSLTWTLCNCIDPLAVLLDVRNHIADGGLLIVAESSRILVPFKKSLNDLFPKAHPADIHPFYWSKNSLEGLLWAAGFEPISINRYFDSDSLVIIAKKNSFFQDEDFLVDCDDVEDVLGYFDEYSRSSNYFECLR